VVDNHSMKQKKQHHDSSLTIGIDARLYGPLGRGLGRYIEEVIKRVVALDSTNKYVLFLSPRSFNDCYIEQANVQKVIMSQRWYSLAEQLAWPRLIHRYHLDMLHVPHFNAPLICPCPLIITIHDLILTKFPSRRASTLAPLLYWFKNLAYRVVISRAVKQAKMIIAVSEFTKQDLVQQLNVSPEKIKVIYNGLSTLPLNSPYDFKADRDILLRYNIKTPYWLYVGSAYPHKNLEWLVQLFIKWSEQHTGYQLVLVGEHDYFYERLIKFIVDLSERQRVGDIICPGFVPDESLAALYRQAAVYVFPSRYEGFGLPPLEAMSYGCPVLASDSSCLPEILGPAAVYFKDNDMESALTAMEKILRNENYRQRFIVLGFEQIKKYNWDNCAQETLKIYQQVLFHNVYK